MKIKTFYTRSMAEALQEIKTHLGPEALLLSTKEIPGSSGRWSGSSGFEVVAATDVTGEGDLFSRGGSSGFADDRLFSDLEPAAVSADECCGYRTGKSTTASKRRKKPGSGSSRVVDRKMSSEREPRLRGIAPLTLYRDLINSGVRDGLAGKILVAAIEKLPAGRRGNRSVLLKSAAQAVLSFLPVSSSHSALPTKKVVALIGPTGVGKTTTIVKLAARLALQERKKVVLMTLDACRIGAVDQLRTYAGLMGLPFRFVGEVSEFPQAIEENTRRDYILVDTPGRRPKDVDEILDLAGVLKQRGDIERHLVLSATTKTSDMREITERFEVCSPDHLVFTKLDETSTRGLLLNELVRTQMSLSYYTNGQKVPDDLHAYAAERIIDIVLGAD